MNGFGGGVLRGLACLFFGFGSTSGVSEKRRSLDEGDVASRLFQQGIKALGDKSIPADEVSGVSNGYIPGGDHLDIGPEVITGEAHSVYSASFLIGNVDEHTALAIDAEWVVGLDEFLQHLIELLFVLGWHLPLEIGDFGSDGFYLIGRGLWDADQMRGTAIAFGGEEEGRSGGLMAGEEIVGGVVEVSDGFDFDRRGRRRGIGGSFGCEGWCWFRLWWWGGLQRSSGAELRDCRGMRGWFLFAGEE